MRIYQPAGVVATLERLLEDERVRAAVVAHRVLPERAAQTAPFPEWLDKRLVARPPRRRASRCSTPTRREALDALRARRGHRRRHAHRLGQVALLQPARAPGGRRRPGRPGALPVPDQGAQPGPAGGVPRAGRRGRDRRRRRASTTATRPAPIRAIIRAAGPGRGDQPGHAPLARSCPITPSGSSSSSSCATSSSTRRTPTAASSAATSPTCCAGCCACATTTAATRRSSAARRRSAIPGELAETLTGRPMTVIDRNGAPAGREARRHPQPAGRRRAPGHAAGTARAVAPRGARVPARRPPDDRLRPRRASRSSCC